MPSTVLRWRRELIARRWTYPPTGRGRRGLDEQVVALVVRLARENPRWGYLRVVGGVPQPRRSGVGDLGTTDPASPPDRTRTLAGRAELDAVLHAQASGLLPRTSSRSRPSGWPGYTCCSLSRSNGVQCTWWSVGVPASPQPADGPRGTGAPIPVPDARPRREVQRRVRRGVHHIRHRRR